MKIVNYAIFGILVGTGGFAIVLAGKGERPTGEAIALGIVLVTWGMALFYYQSNSYRGGAASVIGAILLGIGVWNAPVDVFWTAHPAVREAWISAVTDLFIVGSGIALLIQGHRIHKQRTGLPPQ